MPLERAVVDAFTAEPFTGNPAAVAILDAFADKARMQAVAREMNSSETAFVVPIAEDPVTGSAHCTLAVYGTARLGDRTLIGEQASPRGGTVRMRPDGDRVTLSGQAVTVARTMLLAWD